MAVTEPDPRHDRDDRDEPPVYDLDDPVADEAVPSRPGAVSDVSERERLVAATVADASARDTRYLGTAWRPRPAVLWWKWGVASLLALAALAAALAPPPWARGPAPPALSAGDREAGIDAALFLQAEQIEAFRAREDRLPATLEEAGPTVPGIRYIRSNSRVFQLVAAREDGSVAVWDSANPPPEREAWAQRWLPAREGP